jgi:hypothetical protein
MAGAGDMGKLWTGDFRAWFRYWATGFQPEIR